MATIKNNELRHLGTDTLNMTLTATGIPTFPAGLGITSDPRDTTNYSLLASVGGNALTLALKNRAGADPSAGSSVDISFRNAVAATGDYAVVSATAATSITISSGSTLGHASNIATYFYIYALNNAGTVELAVSTTLFDCGSVQSTTAEGGAGAADSAAVLYSTAARSGKAIRLLARLLSTQTTAGTWTATPTEISLAGTFAPLLNIPTSQVLVDTANGHGSTNNKIRRFTNFTATGSDITGVDSATNGASFTINSNGVYAISYGDYKVASAASIGLSNNSAALTTAIASITTPTRLMQIDAQTGSPSMCSWVGRLAAGDVIRAHTDGTPDGTTRVTFVITQLAKY